MMGMYKSKIAAFVVALVMWIAPALAQSVTPQIGGGISFGFDGGISGKGGPATYLGQVATHTGIPNAWSGAANTQAMIRSRHIMRATTTQIAVVWPTFFVNSSPGEAPLPVSQTMTMALEYPVGTFTRITFSGATSVVQAGGTLLQSDFVPAPPNGAAFFIRTWLNNTGGGLIQSHDFASGALIQAGRDAVNGEQVQFSFGGAVTDVTMGGTITSNDGGTGQIGMGPAAIVGITSTPSFYLFGDSRCQPDIDIYNDASTNNGDCARVVGPNYPYINNSFFARAVSTWNGQSSPLQIQLAHYCSHLFSELGYNDIGSSTGAQTVTNLQTAWASLGFPASRVFQGTLPPGSSSTDGWQTLANQTALANQTNRVAFNTLVRAGISGTPGFVDFASVTESSLNSGKWGIPASLSTFTANLATTVLTVTSIPTNGGTIAPGVFYSGSAANGQIASNGTGTGSTGTYNVTLSGTASGATFGINVPSLDGVHETPPVALLYFPAGILNTSLVHYP